MMLSDSLAAAFAERLGRRALDSSSLDEMWLFVEGDDHVYSLSFIGRACAACESLDASGVDVDFVLDGNGNGNARAAMRRGTTPIAAQALNDSGELVAN